jgi:hypothetical protein
MISSATDYNYQNDTTLYGGIYVLATTATTGKEPIRYKIANIEICSSYDIAIFDKKRATKDDALKVLLNKTNARKSQWILLAGLKLKLIAPKILHYTKTRFNRRMIRCNRKGIGLRIKKCLA